MSGFRKTLTSLMSLTQLTVLWVLGLRKLRFEFDRTRNDCQGRGTIGRAQPSKNYEHSATDNKVEIRTDTIVVQA
ncbi:unnamed protein product, partial [Iphiclides podalirius]